MAHNGESQQPTCLSSGATLGDALRIAMDFELASFHLYSGLAGKVDSQARPMVLRLADECESHYVQLQALGGGAELAQQLSQACTVRLRAEALRRAISLPDLPEKPIEDDVLNYAEIRERLAYDYYGCLERLPKSPFMDASIARLRERKQRQGEEIRLCCSALFLIF